jgi:hypothetical protein
LTLVTIITPTTGNPFLERALNGVRTQTYKAIQHLVVIDGAERAEAARPLLASHKCDVIELPYATGLDRYNGHRIHGAATLLARGDLICWLDEDNWMEPDHIASLARVIKGGQDWAFSLRRIVNREGQYICDDDCESLGKWPSILGPDDYLVDVNCFMLKKSLAVKVTPIWHTKAREPGQMEVDRLLTKVLRERAPKFDTNYSHTLNYRVENTPLSVTAKFFIDGNTRMKQIRGSRLPWRR